MNQWFLIPGKGIENKYIKLYFGLSKLEVRERMSNYFSCTQNPDYLDEYDFVSSDKNTSIMIRYDDSDMVQNIEFSKGLLIYQGINLCGETTFTDIEKKLTLKGYTFRDTEWLGAGKDCIELKINIATREHSGGEGDTIEWVVLSSYFE